MSYQPKILTWVSGMRTAWRRSPEPGAVGVLSYAGRLCLCLHYDARVLDLGQATDLLERFVAAAGKQGD